MTVIVKHNKTNSITDWTQAQLDEQIALGNFAPGTTLANIVLPSDWNNDHTLTGLGTMAEQDATAVAITGGTINNTTIGATTATTGKFTSVTTPSVTATTTNLNLYPASTGNVIVNQSSGGAFGLTLAQDISTPTNSARLFFDSNVNVASIRNNAGGGLAISTGATIGSTSGAIQFQVAPTTSAVNYVQVTGAATGSNPIISAQGSDSNAGLLYHSKGFGSHQFRGYSGSNIFLNVIAAQGSPVNYMQIGASSSGNAIATSAQGSDTNIPLAFISKGTGAIDLAAGSSGVNISNGGTVTAITRTASNTNYTSIPSVAISAPTTAGGVQATAFANMFLGTVTIAGGGTGYTVGNVLTVVGGTQSTPAQLTVSTVSSGVITGVTISASGFYSVLPTNPVSVTGGSGSSATFNLTAWGVSALSITNAGSGYIEQPTITFSGGGGSGAAAYASVGSAATFKSLANLQLATPAGIGFVISDAGATTNSYWGAIGSSANSPTIRSFGTGSANIDNQSASSLNFRTNSGTTQAVISHTASAVNYVQVTGAATGGQPTISPQGSDTNIPLQFNTKGNQAFNFYTNGGTQRQFRIVHTSSSVNFGYTAGSATGTAVTFGVDALSSDTNIDLALTPKGTGLVRFGTYVAGALLATGYINIKAADGTTYKVLVST
jgi:hypothetical protein